MRVVFDTNIFVSALALPGGTADRAIRRIIEGRDHLIVSRPIINELLDVLARKFRRDSEDLARAAVFVADLGELVESRRRLRVLKDDADNRILEWVAGGAQAIVTGIGRCSSCESFATFESWRCAVMWRIEGAPSASRIRPVRLQSHERAMPVAV